MLLNKVTVSLILWRKLSSILQPQTKTREIVVEDAKAADKPAGDKACSKLLEKAFKKRPKNQYKTETETVLESRPKVKTRSAYEKTSEDLLRDIFDDLILGKGIVKVERKLKQSKYQQMEVL